MEKKGCVKCGVMRWDIQEATENVGLRFGAGVVRTDQHWRGECGDPLSGKLSEYVSRSFKGKDRVRRGLT